MANRPAVDLENIRAFACKLRVSRMQPTDLIFRQPFCGPAQRIDLTLCSSLVSVNDPLIWDKGKTTDRSDSTSANSQPRTRLGPLLVAFQKPIDG